MSKSYQIRIKPIHHSECVIVYSDKLGQLEIWADQSPFPEYDFVTSESEFGLNGNRLSQVLENIYEWSRGQGISIKVWKENEVGK